MVYFIENYNFTRLWGGCPTNSGGGGGGGGGGGAGAGGPNANSRNP